jgi:hypothetical protein
VLRPGTGYVLTGSVGATEPTLANINTFVSAGTLPSGFTELGHTDAEDIIAFDQDGGDSEVFKSWQNAALRQVITDEAVDFFVIPALELSNTVLSLYYGGGDASTANRFELPDTPAATEKAVCIVMVDGTVNVAFYVPKASILRDDSPEFATDAFAKFPLRFTVLKATSDPRAVWIADRLGSA